MLAARSNFFLGNDPARWRTNVPSYARVAQSTLAGVDVVWHGGDGSGLEYDFVVAAGVDARALTLEVGGATGVELTPSGALAMTTRAGTLVQRPPRVRQGTRDLRARFVRRDGSHFGFAIDGYDPARAVLIDPVFVYSTYLGGSSSDSASAIAVDAEGNAYVTGDTDSMDFPTVDAFQASYGTKVEAIGDVFVSKLAASGTSLVYSTYLGGSGADGAAAIAVDASGNASITGYTTSTDFPTYAAFQSTGDGTSSFVTKLDATGSALVFSSYFGGNAYDDATAIAADASGNTYVAGTTSSTNLATSNAFQPTFGGVADAFVSEIDPSGALVYTTYLGGSNEDGAAGIAVDGSGEAVVVGSTESTDFPTLTPLQSANAGTTDAFIAKLDASGVGLVYATYLGGSYYDAATAVALDASGSAYVTGTTISSDFPTRAPFQPTLAGDEDCFVTKLNASGSVLVYSSFLGGSSEDMAEGIAVDGSGNAYVTGTTDSFDFLLENAMQPILSGPYDAFVAKVNTGLLYSTFLGGSDIDEGQAIAADGSGNAYVVGWTSSTDFPTANALKPVSSGQEEVFISEIATPNLAPGSPCTAAGVCGTNHCVDGVCCDTTCTDECEACDVAGHVGTCTGVVGPPHGPREACNGGGTCGGSCDGTHPTCAYPAIACGSTCTGGRETDSVCDGDGGCVTTPSFSCNAFACDEGARCKTSCLSDDDCAPGITCVNGACGPAPVCVNDHRSQRADGTTADCSPYACGDAGLCMGACAQISDCAAGWVCTDNACVLPPYPSSCTLGRTRTNANPTWPCAWLAVIVVSRRLARRRKAAKPRSRQESPLQHG
jgi:hypothetical protein